MSDEPKTEVIQSEPTPLDKARKYLAEHDAQASLKAPYDGKLVYAPDYLLAAAILYDEQPTEFRGLQDKLKHRGFRSTDFERKVKDVHFARKAKEREDAKQAKAAVATSINADDELGIMEVEPWDAPVDGAILLPGLIDAIKKYCALPEHAPLAIALFTLHTYLLDAADTAPRLSLTSPAMRCGKTTLLTVLSFLVQRALAASNITTAALFRAMEAGHPTLLVDEFDSFQAVDEQLRGILNSGHKRRNAYIIRTVGDEHKPTRFSTWGSIIIAMIGKLPGTVADRSISIRMRRRTKNDKLSRFTKSDEAALEKLARQCARFANDNLDKLKAATDPSVPEAMNDRARDNWRPLLAIGELFGGEWAKQAREAALILSDVSKEDSEDIGAQLLSDLRELFKSKERWFSRDLVVALGQLEGRPWSEVSNGRPLTQHKLAALLAPYEVGPHTIREGEHNAKGYMKKDFFDAFDRYLPFQTVTTSQPNAEKDLGPISKPSQTPLVTDAKNTSKPNGEKGCDVVTVQKPEIPEHESEKGKNDPETAISRPRVRVSK